MRIIAGRAKGTKLHGPADGTRPFTDRNREALFSSLGSTVESADVLDLFSGTGSLGLEALSRGAATATLVDSSQRAGEVIRANVRAVGLGGDVVVAFVEYFLKVTRDHYDLAFVDPPYELALPSVEEVLASLSLRLRVGATVVLHRRYGEQEPEIEFPLQMVWNRRHGDANLTRYEVTEGHCAP